MSLLTSGGGGGAAEPAFGAEIQLAIIVGLVVALIILSYIYSIMGFEYGED